MRISVLTGPVLRDDDPIRFQTQIPVEFWKVIAFIHDDTGKLTATGYLMSQASFLEPEEFVFGGFDTYQLPIASIEKKTGLSFGTLGRADPLKGAGRGSGPEAHGPRADPLPPGGLAATAFAATSTSPLRNRRERVRSTTNRESDCGTKEGEFDVARSAAPELVQEPSLAGRETLGGVGGPAVSFAELAHLHYRWRKALESSLPDLDRRAAHVSGCPGRVRSRARDDRRRVLVLARAERGRAGRAAPAALSSPGSCGRGSGSIERATGSRKTIPRSPSRFIAATRSRSGRRRS